MVLSNHDKASHTDQRGLDSRMVQTEQFHDHTANRRNFDDQAAAGAGANTSGMSAPMTDTSGDDSSLETKHRD